VDRRAFIRAVGFGLLTAPLGAEAQRAGRVYRLGMLFPTTPPFPGDQRTTAILIPPALRELGYVEGQNLVIERRYAEGKLERLPGLTRELVQLRVDVIVAVSAAAIRAARDATATIPIVMYGNLDPVAAGFVASLARPGGNLTGVLIAPRFFARPGPSLKVYDYSRVRLIRRTNQPLRCPAAGFRLHARRCRSCGPSVELCGLQRAPTQIPIRSTTPSAATKPINPVRVMSHPGWAALVLRPPFIHRPTVS